MPLSDEFENMMNEEETNQLVKDENRLSELTFQFRTSNAVASKFHTFESNADEL